MPLTLPYQSETSFPSTARSRAWGQLEQLWEMDLLHVSMSLKLKSLSREVKQPRSRRAWGSKACGHINHMGLTQSQSCIAAKLPPLPQDQLDLPKMIANFTSPLYQSACPACEGPTHPQNFIQDKNGDNLFWDNLDPFLEVSFCLPLNLAIPPPLRFAYQPHLLVCHRFVRSGAQEDEVGGS